jgi:hypothetical protein
MTLLSNIKNKIKKFFDKLKYSPKKSLIFKGVYTACGYKKTGSSDEISDVEIMDDYYDKNFMLTENDEQNNTINDIIGNNIFEQNEELPKIIENNEDINKPSQISKDLI